MEDLKISLITVVYNAQNTIEHCIQSVVGQQFHNLEYIVIDGGSTDGTVEIIKKYQEYIAVFVSEPDKGIYDAMNKGIALASGDVIGMLNADDYYANDNILNIIATVFSRKDIDILYGNLDYVNPDGKTKRQWRSAMYNAGMFNWGWMPPHPTFYCRMELFKKFGGYSLSYGSAADYELMLRFMHRRLLKVYFLDMVLIKMTVGGVSNGSLANRIRVLQFDWKAMRKNGVTFPAMTLFLKPLRKIGQFI